MLPDRANDRTVPRCAQQRTGSRRDCFSPRLLFINRFLVCVAERRRSGATNLRHQLVNRTYDLFLSGRAPAGTGQFSRVNVHAMVCVSLNQQQHCSSHVVRMFPRKTQVLQCRISAECSHDCRHRAGKCSLRSGGNDLDLPARTCELRLSA